MANLVIDIGNSRTKIAVFNNRDITRIDTHDTLTQDILAGYLTEDSLTQAIVSSVAVNSEWVAEQLERKMKTLRFSFAMKNGISNHYRSPQTLGADRLAAVIGAHSLYKDRDVLVIDAGTCITYDSVDGQGNYYGGSISPGLNMRLKAMHTFTGRLPLVAFEGEYTGDMGTDTRSSMLSGVVNGTLEEVKGMIGKFLEKAKTGLVLLCGGSSNFFDTRLKNSIFAHSLKTEANLVLIGLNEVIHQNNE